MIKRQSGRLAGWLAGRLTDVTQRRESRVWGWLAADIRLHLRDIARETEGCAAGAQGKKKEKREKNDTGLRVNGGEL